MKDGQQIGIWVAIAKNGVIQVFTKEPTRGNAVWVGEVYINSIIYDMVTQVVKNSALDWNSEPEYLEFKYVATDSK